MSNLPPRSRDSSVKLLEVLRALKDRQDARLWKPLPDPAPAQPHPQRLAVESPADELTLDVRAGRRRAAIH